MFNVHTVCVKLCSPLLFQMYEIKRKRETVTRWLDILSKGNEVPPPPDPVWKRKFPQIQWPEMKQEKELSPLIWEASHFPHRDLQDSISGQISYEVWHNKIEQLSSSVNPPYGLIQTMLEVGHQLTFGVDSGVEHPGTSCTQSPNFFPDPEAQIPRVIDALASFTSKGHMAGPLFNKDESEIKINSIMAVKKPGVLF